jgi:hypothetical protein
MFSAQHIGLKNPAVSTFNFEFAAFMTSGMARNRMARLRTSGDRNGR